MSPGTSFYWALELLVFDSMKFKYTIL